MTFIWPWMLLLLLLIPLFIWGYVWLGQRRQRETAVWGTMGVMQSQTGQKLGRKRHIPITLYLIGLAFLFVGLARPEMFVDLPQVSGTVILAFDVSNSMIAEDLEPTRMEAAKTAAKIFVENQPGTIDIGVVAFSNGGLVVQPPTNDQAVLLETVDRLTPQGATSLGHGIFTSLNAIAGNPVSVDLEAFEEGIPALEIDDVKSAVILLLTDGENTESPDPLLIAQLAAEAGVRIYPIGIGSAEGSVIELDGYSILSQLNEGMLQDIASLTNGVYYQADDEETLQEIYENVDLQLTISGEKTEVTAVFAGIGVLFFLIGALLALIWLGRMPL